MSYSKKQRTRIEDLSADGNELFELSEQMMMMVGGGYGSVSVEPGTTKYACSSTGGSPEAPMCDVDYCTSQTTFGDVVGGTSPHN